VTGIVPLVEANDESLYGAKALGLGDALRAGLPVPPGVALSGPEVDLIASGDDAATAALREALAEVPMPVGPASPASTSPS
jgi:pyruvate, water dikinase